MQPKEITWSPSRVFPPVRACMFSSLVVLYENYLTHVHGTQRDGTDEPRHGAAWWGGGRHAQERGDTRIPVADSCRCVTEANTTLQRNHPPIKNK